MTLPEERFNSLMQTRQFLLDLLDPKKTPKVPKYVRQLASNNLRHFPWTTDLEQLPKALPKVFKK